MRKERLRVKGGTAAEKDIFLFIFFCGGGGGVFNLCFAAIANKYYFTTDHSVHVALDRS